MSKINFIREYVRPIKNGEKWLTFRYHFDESIDEGDVVQLFETDEGKKFAEAKIDWLETMTVEEIAGKDWQGHRNYSDIPEAIWAFSHYYPSDEITPETEMTVVGFTVLKRYDL